MSIAVPKPTFVENLFHTFFNLQIDRMGYYNAVFQNARNIFMNLGKYELAEQLDEMIRNNIELPYKTKLWQLLKWYYDPKHYFKKRVYFKVGDRIDYVKVTKMEIEQKLEEIKRWCYDELSVMANDVRFSAIMQVQG
jgi:hypothetical protein